MLTHAILDTFSTLDTARQSDILTDWQLLDTPEGDAVMGHLAGTDPNKYSALIVALARGGE